MNNFFIEETEKLCVFCETLSVAFCVESYFSQMQTEIGHAEGG